MNTLEIELCQSALTEVAELAEADGEKYISFSLRGRLCCVLAAAVEEVIQPTQATAVPNAQPWLVGLISYRGEPAAVIDQRLIVNEPAPALLTKPKMIVFGVVPNRTRFVLPIDSVHEFVTLPASLDRPLGNSPTKPIVHEGRSLLVLQHTHLFESLTGSQPLPE